MKDEKQQITDENLKEKMESTNNKFDELCDVYRNYVGKAETEKGELYTKWDKKTIFNMALKL